MPRYRRAVDNGMLPPLHFDWSLPAPLLLDSAARQLSENGVLSELMVDVDGPAGKAVIPLLCDIGSESWVPYVQGEPWSDEAIQQFVDWVHLIRQSTHNDVRLQFYSRHPVPDIVIALAQNTPIARLQMDAHNNGEPHAFASNAVLLQRLAKEHLEVDLPFDADAVNRLDEIITDHLGDDAPLVATQALVHLVGCFVGEVVVHTHNCAWEPSGVRWVVGPTRIDPLAIAVERFSKGSRAPMFAYLPD